MTLTERKAAANNSATDNKVEKPDNSSTEKSNIGQKNMLPYYVFMAFLIFVTIIFKAQDLGLHKICWTCYLGPLGRPIQEFFKAQIDNKMDGGFEGGFEEM